jgi:hypothetical protein
MSRARRELGAHCGATTTEPSRALFGLTPVVVECGEG